MDPRKMMGFDSPADAKVPVRVGDWNGMKLAMWRCKYALELSARAAAEIIERCEHAAGCPGATVETEPCLKTCRDREQRMSALVILNAARQFAPIAPRPADAPYFAPSREYFSEVLADLAATQAELAIARALLEKLGHKTQPASDADTDPAELAPQTAPPALPPTTTPASAPQEPST